MLLANGYRLVDAAVNKGPGGDATAVAFINQNAGGMFTAANSEYNSPPERWARPHWPRRMGLE